MLESTIRHQLFLLIYSMGLFPRTLSWQAHQQSGSAIYEGGSD